MKIRNLKKEEFGQFIELHEKIFVPLWKKIGREYNLDSIKRSLNQSFDSGKWGFIAAEENGKIVGCSVSQIQSNAIYGKNILYIYILVVDPDCQKTGIGKSLMENEEKFAKSQNIDILQLEVSIRNLDAIKFYEKLGYKTIRNKMEKKLA